MKDYMEYVAAKWFAVGVVIMVMLVITAIASLFIYNIWIEALLVSETVVMVLSAVIYGVAMSIGIKLDKEVKK